MGNRIAEGLLRAKLSSCQFQVCFSIPTTVSPFIIFLTLGFVEFSRVATSKIYQFHRSSNPDSKPSPSRSLGRARANHFVLLFAAPSLSYFIKVGKAYVQFALDLLCPMSRIRIQIHHGGTAMNKNPIIPQVAAHHPRTIHVLTLIESERTLKK
jgi:hypothetical protein